MNRDGFRTSTGRRWGKTTVHKVLTNEAYCGTLVWGGRPGHPTIHSDLPPDGKSKDTIPVLPIDTFGGAGVTIGRTFELEFSLAI